MTLAEAQLIFDYWAEQPPPYLMVQAIARMLGWKPAETASSSGDLLAAPPPGLTVTSEADIGVPAPVFDIEALRARNRARLAETPASR
jgi:hypothetical protein